MPPTVIPDFDDPVWADKNEALMDGLKRAALAVLEHSGGASIIEIPLDEHTTLRIARKCPPRNKSN